jgi:phage terminase large subunit-like protein
VRLVPESCTSAGGEAAELAASAGLVLDRWQADVLDDFLSERPDGKWAALECGLIVPRQNGKSRALEALALHALFLDPDARLTLWSAHQFKTAREAFRNLQAMVTNYDHLRKLVKAVRASHGEEGIELKDGSRLNFVARSRTSGRGFSGDKLILDEAQEIDPEDIASSLPMLSARPNPQIIYAGTVSDTADHLRGLRDRAEANDGETRLAVTEYGADPDELVDDPAQWAAANPSFGTRLDPEFAAMEFKSMPLESFKQERLGLWPPRVGESGPVTPEVWAELVDLDSTIPGVPTFSVDVSPDRSSAAVAAAGRSHVEVIDARSGVGWVVDRCAALCADHGGEVVLDPGGAAGALITALEAAEVPLRLMKTRDVVQACGSFIDAVANSTIRHLDQPSLNAAVSGASLRSVGEASAWSRKNSSVDITPLVAATNALWGAGTSDLDGGEPSMHFI